MATLNDLWSQIQRFFPLNKRSILLLVVLLGFLLWGGFRACSSDISFDENRVFKIARDPTWYPLNLMGKEKSLLAFTNDLILSIGNKENLRIELINSTADTLFKDLQDHDHDAIISSLMPTSSNRQQFNFSDPLYLIGPVLIVPSDSNVTSIKEMDGKSVGIKRGANSLYDVHEYKIYYVPYDSMTIAFDDLNRDRIDGVLLPILQAYTYTQTFYTGRIKIVTPPLTREGIRLIAIKNQASDFFIDKFNKGLKASKEDGTTDRLLAKWGLVSSVVNDTLIPQPSQPPEMTESKPDVE